MQPDPIVLGSAGPAEGRGGRGDGGSPVLWQGCDLRICQQPPLNRGPARRPQDKSHSLTGSWELCSSLPSSLPARQCQPCEHRWGEGASEQMQTRGRRLGLTSRGGGFQITSSITRRTGAPAAHLPISASLSGRFHTRTGTARRAEGPGQKGRCGFKAARAHERAPLAGPGRSDLPRAPDRARAAPVTGRSGDTRHTRQERPVKR